jgi:hypothetical protein
VPPLSSVRSVLSSHPDRLQCFVEAGRSARTNGSSIRFTPTLQHTRSRAPRAARLNMEFLPSRHTTDRTAVRGTIIGSPPVIVTLCASISTNPSGNRANLIDMRAPYEIIDRFRPITHGSTELPGIAGRTGRRHQHGPRTHRAGLLGGPRPSKDLTGRRVRASRFEPITSRGRRESIRAANSRLARHPPPVLKRSMVLPWNLGEWVAYS